MKNYYRRSLRKVLLATAVLMLPALMWAQQDSAYFVSDSSWWKSTTTTPSNNQGFWSGVNGVLPAAGTFTIPAPIGQPYPYHSIDSVEGAEVINTGNHITYFRKVIMMDTLNDISARIRVSVDDHVEVYINGTLLVGEYDAVTPANWKAPSFDAHIAEDGTITNPYMGGDAYDSVVSVDLDSLLSPGANEIIVVCRNLAGALNRGGFSFRLDVKGTPGIPTVQFIVSTDAFTKSTTTTPSNLSGFWGGVNGNLPDSSTFTLSTTEGQPYSYHSIDSVPEAEVIKAPSSITYYRYTFEILDDSLLNARFRMTVDDAMEIYVNGFFIAREENTGPVNFKNPPHDIEFQQNGTVLNGFMGGNSYDVHTNASMDDVFQLGMNELILVVRNLGKAGDAGGFSFRMDLDANGTPVIKKSAKADGFFTPSDSNLLTADIFPNPSTGVLNVAVEYSDAFDVYVYDMNGRLLTNIKDQTYRATLDISNFARGVYFVKVVSDSKTYSGKVMKQ